ncbi:PIF1 [Diaporthe helianthi]|uniref:ATP-dependent DNA helicase n=1 Tax=Diaporthe helianthi TaxID=158607 RepID=A0A2P5HPP7_DIAHE|nr:PIF1 [Diaporthe helianthi]
MVSRAVQLQLQEHRVLGATVGRVSFISSLDRRGLASAHASFVALRAPKPFIRGSKPAVLNYSINISATASRNEETEGSESGFEAPGSDEPPRVVGPRLSPEQAKVVALAASGRNIFYTGSAGSGKSTVLHAIVQRLEHMGKRVWVLAPTGRAALAINGRTTWSFAGWTPNSHKHGIEELKATARDEDNPAVPRFRKTDVVIIDEISMVENLHFERLDQVMRAARHTKDFPAEHRPFGGVQVIVTGDFAQLPPVRPFGHCIECGSEMRWHVDDEDDSEIYSCGRCKITYNVSDQWAFRSKAWEECNFEYVYLDTIHRQHDPAFISLLNKCRMGDPFTPEDIKLLTDHETDTTGAVELYPTREEVRLVNEREFQKLATKAYSFQCRDTFDWEKKKHPKLRKRGEKHADGSLKSLKGHSMNRRLELKYGMPVVLVANLDLDRGLCNGSQGIIVGWTPPNRSETRPRLFRGSYGTLKAHEIRTYETTTDEPVWPIVRFTNGLEREIRAVCQVNELGDDVPYSLLCRTQLPLIPAWALSIHKAQGMTLDKVRVDVSKAFADGQVYVALSRATSLQGLQILGDARSLELKMRANKEVRSFYREKFGR